MEIVKKYDHCPHCGQSIRVNSARRFECPGCRKWLVTGEFRLFEFVMSMGGYALGGLILMSVFLFPIVLIGEPWLTTLCSVLAVLFLMRTPLKIGWRAIRGRLVPSTEAGDVDYFSSIPMGLPKPVIKDASGLERQGGLSLADDSVRGGIELLDAEALTGQLSTADHSSKR